MTIVSAKWSLQDYHQMIETGILDERKVELVRGEIIEMSPEGAPHLSLVVFRNLTITGYQSTTSFMTGTISFLALPNLVIDIQQLLA